MHARLALLHRLYGRPVAYIVGGVYALVGAVQFVAQNFGSSHVIAKLRLGDYTPSLTGWEWLALGLFLILAVGFEGAYREITALNKSPRVLGDFQFPEIQPVPGRTIATKEELSQSHIQNRSVFLVDLPLKGERVVDIVLSDCDIYGPAVIHLLPDSTSELATVGAFPDDPESVVWEIDGTKRKAQIGAIVFQRSRMLRCQFFGIGFAGSKAEMDQFRGSFVKKKA